MRDFASELRACLAELGSFDAERTFIAPTAGAPRERAAPRAHETAPPLAGSRRARAPRRGGDRRGRARARRARTRSTRAATRRRRRRRRRADPARRRRVRPGAAATAEHDAGGAERNRRRTPRRTGRRSTTATGLREARRRRRPRRRTRSRREADHRHERHAGLHRDDPGGHVADGPVRRRLRREQVGAHDDVHAARRTRPSTTSSGSPTSARTAPCTSTKSKPPRTRLVLELRAALGRSSARSIRRSSSSAYGTPDASKSFA